MVEMSGNPSTPRGPSDALPPPPPSTPAPAPPATPATPPATPPMPPTVSSPGVEAGGPGTIDIPATPPADATPTAAPTPAAAPTAPVTADPALPEQGSNRRPTVVPPTRNARGTTARYRSDDARKRSVHRRANPWHRQIARLVIGAVITAIVGGGLYLGAREFEQWWNRDRLPALGVETPDIRTANFVINSESPAPDLDGRLTIDTTTGAFEFVGREGGSDEGWHAISPDGRRIVLRQGTEPWREAVDDDPIADEIRIVTSYLRKADGVDTLLPARVRQHVELVQQSTDVTTSGEWTRYDLLVNTEAFSRQNVIEWTEFRRDAVPGAAELAALPMTIWVDDDGVLVRLVDDTSGWRWERLAYLSEPFAPDDPTAAP